MNSSSNKRLNEKLFELMENLSNIMLKQGEPFRARAYQKAQETILSHTDDIISPEQLKGYPNIGPTIINKIEEFVETGTLKLLEKEKENPINILAEVYGIGPKKAKELVENGITTITQLRENQQKLNDVQKIGLKYYEDILKRIPRQEIDEYKDVFDKIFINSQLTKNIKYEIVGSYRRGAQTSGDIDVIITSNDTDVFIKFIDLLVKNKVITEILSRGPSKCLVIAKHPSSPTYRRVDFLFTSLEEFPFAILYFTGSKIFNTVMRHIALQMGLTMNEHGLYYLQNKEKEQDKKEKVSHKFESEKDIFDYLGLEYKSPEERIDGRAIIQNNKTTTTTITSKDNKNTIIKKNTTLKKKSVLKTETKPKITIENNTNDTKKIIENFKNNGITFLNNLNESQLSSVIKEANDAYYNNTQLLTDNEYDIIKEFIELKFPQNITVKQIGAPVTKNKSILPYKMASMNKIKPDTNALAIWMLKYKGPYVLSCKLDGVSGLYTTEGPTAKLYTRGDGTIGQDISHLIPYLKLPQEKNIVIRGEFIIPKKIFETKYKTIFANPRNMVAGLINQKTVNESVADINFVAYEVIKPIQNPSQQFSYLTSLNTETVLHGSHSTLTNELLSQTLIEWRQKYVYEIDGIIVTDDNIYKREDGNPEHSFAFKMVLTEQITEAKVIDVIWTPSKDGYLKPRVQIEPIQLGGVCIEYATGFNAAFIYENKIGVGAVIEIIRSGDVIPHIRKIICPAVNPKMPSIDYKWNDTHIDVIVENIDSDITVREKIITGFFKGIGVDGLSSGNITRIIQSGYDTIAKILQMEKHDFLKIDGFKEKMATKLYEGIKNKIIEASLLTIMSSSNIFGRGFSEKKLELILNSYPNILISSETKNQKVQMISSIKGMATKTSELFVTNIDAFINFLKDTGLESKLNTSADADADADLEKHFVCDKTHPLFEKTIIMTGFRDINLQNELKEVGAKIGTSVSKNTFLVLSKNGEEEYSSKAEEAKKLGIPLLTLKEFREKYLS